MAKSTSFEKKFRQAFVNAAMGVLARDDAGFTDPSKWKVAGKEGKFYIDDGTMEGTGSLFASKPEAERALAQMKASRLPLLGGGKVEKVDKGYGRDAAYRTWQSASGEMASGEFQNESKARKLAEQLRVEGWQNIKVWQSAGGWNVQGIKANRQPAHDSSFLKNGEEIRHLRLVRDGIKFRCQNRAATPEEKEEIQSINKQIMQLKTGTVGAKDALPLSEPSSSTPKYSQAKELPSNESWTHYANRVDREVRGEKKGKDATPDLEAKIAAARSKMNKSRNTFEEEEARSELRRLEGQRRAEQGEDVSPEQQTDAYHKGVKAGASGVQREANPYSPGSEEHGRWIYGHAYGRAGETAGHDAFDEPASEEQRKKNDEWNRNQRPNAEGQELYNRTSGHAQATKKKLDWWPAHQHNPDPSQYDGLDENDEIEEEGGMDASADRFEVFQENGEWFIEGWGGQSLGPYNNKAQAERMAREGDKRMQEEADEMER